MIAKIVVSGKCESAFKGNPEAVSLLKEQRDDEWIFVKRTNR